MKDIKWGRPTHFKRHGISHLRSVTPSLLNFGSPAFIMTTIKGRIDPPYHTVFLAKLGPGGFIIPHIDAGPWRERWHIPIAAAGWFWEDGQFFQPEEEVPFRVRHWLPHAVYNPTNKERVHLIVDRVEKPGEAPEDGPLKLTPMIPEIQQMIDKIDEP